MLPEEFNGYLLDYNGLLNWKLAMTENSRQKVETIACRFFCTLVVLSILHAAPIFLL